MRPELLKYASDAVPRYTSYPTALQFNGGVDEGVYRDWLARLSPDDRLSLYLHIPFCRQLCWYCGCHTTVAHRYPPIQGYLKALSTEIDLVGQACGNHGPAVHVHFGGGTPSLLEVGDFADILKRLDRSLGLGPCPEIAMEIDPRSLTVEKARGFAAAGLNRASLGVQDIDPEVQALINRIQSFDQVQQAMDWLRGAGVGSINIDLMYGLPGQGEAEVAASATAVAGLGAERVSVFGYAHVPWFKKHQGMIRDADLPDIPARMAQAKIAADVLLSAGYRRIGFDHYALSDDEMAGRQKSGRLKRNFQGYTTDDAEVLVGLGASSIGSLPQGYAQNAPDIKLYSQSLAAGRLPTARGVAFRDDDLLRRSAIERIMCDEEIGIGALCRDWGYREDALDDGLMRAGALAQDGLVRLEDRRLIVTSDGEAFRRSIAACFDSYLDSDRARHSKAI